MLICIRKHTRRQMTLTHYHQINKKNLTILLKKIVHFKSGKEQ